MAETTCPICRGPIDHYYFTTAADPERVKAMESLLREILRLRDDGWIALADSDHPGICDEIAALLGPAP